ncbi:MAG: hypothetical protein KDD70_04005 [Bdellovibrionales bacterium]|nr:hypothetical protein [Bdellovibrionales bacterium]
MIDSLFHTLIYHKKLLNNRSKLFAELQEEAFQIRDFDEDGVAWSERHYPGGFTSYASRNDLHYMSSTFHALEERIRPCVYEFAEELGYDLSGLELSISDMWLNIMGPGCVHTGHIHPLSFISGTYYVQVPPGASGLQFEDPRLGFQMACPPKRKKLQQSQQTFVTHKPTAGGLVLFESWLRHEVPPHIADDFRISVSFNYNWSDAVDETEE